LRESLRGVASPDAWPGLQEALNALREGALDTALRSLDRAWRCLPHEAATLAPIYARLMSLEAHDLDASLRLLQRAIDVAPDPDLAALLALTLLRLERFQDARRHLEEALAEYCVESGGLLFHVACQVTGHPAIQAPGWIGRGPNLELVGELSSQESANVLDIKMGGHAAFTQLLRRPSRGGGRTFSLPAPPLSFHTPLYVSSRGVHLVGSGSRTPSDFALNGRAGNRGNRLTGWVRMKWLPTRPLRVRVEDERGHRARATTGRVALPGWRQPFWINLRSAGVRGSRIQISALLPDGRWHPLPDSPLLLEPAWRLAGRKPTQLRKWTASPVRRSLRCAAIERAEMTDVIIPVYRGREETLACIQSVLATLDSGSSVTVVDDATEDAELAAALDVLALEGRITLLRNAENIGFVGSVNRALALNPTHDAVLLNSDTLVFGDWLSRLRAAAYSSSAVGTATPLSNSGSIASYPHASGAAVAPEYAAALHALATSTHPGVSVEIPVGVGFCLYLRRDCLRDVGYLDAGVFGKGYGEETDFCMRARGRGWSHRLAADVFVYHAEGLSFGSRRAALLERSQRLINLRYPGYDAFIASFLEQDSLRLVRRRLDEHRLSAFQGRFVLIVTLALSGGVERFVGERCSSLRAKGLFTLILRPAAAGNARRCELWTDAMELSNLRYEIPKELDALVSLLRAMRLEASEIQHFLHLDARLIDAVRALPIPYDVYVHDYAWICPRVTLIDGSGRYCGEPPVSVCQTCVRRNGSSLGEAISVAALRARSSTWLQGARHVVAPSADTATRLKHHFNGLQVDVQPHTAPVAAGSLQSSVFQSKVVRVALIGAIGDHKGYRFLLKCALDARARRLPIEFVVVGYTRDDAPLLATGKVFITGRYSDGEAPYLLERERVDVAWFPSVWPETWCYALDYALVAGLPVLAFDLGAIADRLRAAGAGTLVPLELTPRRINDRLLELVAARPHNLATQRSVQSQSSRKLDQANMMVTLPDDLKMNKTADTKLKQESQATLSASVQLLPLPAGLYLFSVKAASPTHSKINGQLGQLSLPAVHVGLGPGVRTEEVEFIAGPSTHGAWLFAHGDLLVTKVNAPGATLVMTSVRAPGGDVLSIKVERLEERANAISSPQRALSSAAEPESRSPAGSKRRRQVPAKEADKAVGSTNNDLHLPVQVTTHIRARGDMTFEDVPWAGRVAPGLWIESFSVRPLNRLSAWDIEYKGLTGSGFETPWVSDEKMCGTKGMAVPLVGFAARLKPSTVTADYDCEYSGYFQSGVTVGPLRNGAPCRSTVANDPLEGIQIRLLKRDSASMPAGSSFSAVADQDAKAAKRGVRPSSHSLSNRRQPTRRT
jgi:GT2 family glycosyltransferase